MDPSQIEQMLEENIRPLMGKKEEEEAEKFLGKIEDVNSMLGQLMSKDGKEAAEAEDRIDKFLEVQSKEEADQAQRAQFTAGCRTVENRSVINTTEVKEEKRKKEATGLKELGNQAFRRGEHGVAEEYYTSALMQWDKEPVFFTNRAQARIQQAKYQVEICHLYFSVKK